MAKRSPATSPDPTPQTPQQAAQAASGDPAGPVPADGTTPEQPVAQPAPAAHPDGPWIRVRNSVGEFDLHETQVAAGLPGGVEEVPEYPRAHTARPAKPYTDLAGNPATRRTAGEPGGRE